jgi:chaperone required for assembly of F1-ATPase
MKRFYNEAAPIPAENGYAIALDGKPMRTPAKAPLVVPTRALADGIAAEWQAQGEEIQPDALPLTRLASTAIDLIAPRRDKVVAELTAYAGTDLVCYRAAHPPELAARQQQVWQPRLDWATLRYDAPLVVTTGVVPVQQPPASLRAFAAAVALLDDMSLAALNLATRAAGSLVVALALIEGELDAEGAFEAAQLDESFEIEQWGEDDEQMQRRALLREDIALAARFVSLLRD